MPNYFCPQREDGAVIQLGVLSLVCNLVGL